MFICACRKARIAGTIEKISQITPLLAVMFSKKIPSSATKSVVLSFLSILSFWTFTGCSDRARPQPTAAATLSQQRSRSDINESKKEEIFRTPKELLFGVNAWMKQFNLPELTKQELIVRLADQQVYSEAAPRAEYLLEHIVENKRFELPVELRVEHVDDITLSEQYSSRKRLRLPAHYTLAIQILNVPWNSSLDKYGQQMKVNFTNVIIAHAFAPSPLPFVPGSE